MNVKRLSFTAPRTIKLEITDYFGGWVTLFEQEAKDHYEGIGVHQLVQLKIDNIRSQAKEPRVSRTFPPKGKSIRKTVNGFVVRRAL
jgi:hypothetical protein